MVDRCLSRVSLINTKVAILLILMLYLWVYAWVRSDFDEGEVVYLLVSGNVVNQPTQILLTGVGIPLPGHFLEKSIHFARTGHALLRIFSAHDGVSGVFVVANQSSDHAFGEDYDGVALDDVSGGFAGSEGVEVSCVVLIADAGGAESKNVDFAEDVGVFDVDVGNDGESSSQTDACDVDLLQFGLFFDLSQVVEDVIMDGSPHVLIGFLDLAVGADVGVDNLVGIEDILPDVLKGVGVPECEDDEGGVDAEDALDVFGLFLDVVGVEGSVGGIADDALPVDEVELVLAADDHGVAEEHLVDVGEAEGGHQEACQ